MGERVLSFVFIAMVTSLYPATGQSYLPPINKDNLDPDAAHVCVTTISLASETRYQHKTKYRSRNEYKCCNGYVPRIGLTYCTPKCQYDCHHNNSQGFCIYPDKCLCSDGYIGDYCQSNCGPNEWGKDCSQKCDCSEHGSCDPVTGNCICHIGYTGQKCSRSCTDSFGLNCVNPCVCENGATCNNVNGKCTCRLGFYGAYCHKTCDVDGIGEDGCTQTCPCQNGGECDDKGACVCAAGYKGKYCTEKCDNFHWGPGCIKNCTCYRGNCNGTTGACKCDFGYDGDSCQIKCGAGKYGINCESVCHCKNNGTCYYGYERDVLCNCTGTGFHGKKCDVRDCDDKKYLKNGKCETCPCPWGTTNNCHPKTGACQCMAGYTSTSASPCSEKCMMPFYGVDCKEICRCAHGNCHFAHGVCTMCFAGYTGEDCDKECPENTWGIGCQGKCQCSNNADCHATTGYCNCTAGFKGILCDEHCEPNKYGAGCTKDCRCDLKKSICNPYDGLCQCKAGYHGNRCQDECNEGKYGFNCLYPCQCFGAGTQHCEPQTGNCICKPGWKGLTCNSKCDVDSWGPNCQQECKCNGHGSCQQNTGDCICNPGYQGNMCENVCATDHYGYGCKGECPSCEVGSFCDPVTGECKVVTCPPGYRGTDCKQTCAPGTYGEGCKKRCPKTCVTNGVCDPVNGYCVCFPGYIGAHCEKECPPGKFGIQCSYTCPCDNSTSRACDSRNGDCKCKFGFKGQYCDQGCSLDKWGPDCGFNCSDICRSKWSIGCDSQKGPPCVCDPKSGFEGDFCLSKIGANKVGAREGQNGDSSSSAVPIVVGPVIAAIVLILIIIGLVLYFRRRIRQLKDENMNVRFQVNQPPANQTIIPNGHAVGVDNPMYRDENLNNERRYPHLSYRASLPRPPQRQSCDSSNFDDIAEEKLGAGAEVTLPTSGQYDDNDEGRYTTLRSLQGDAGATGSRDSSNNLQKDSYDNKLSEKYMLYTGRRAQNAHDPRSWSPQRSPSRSPSRSSKDSMSYNYANGSVQNMPDSKSRSPTRSPLSSYNIGFENATYVTDVKRKLEVVPKPNRHPTAGVSQPLYGSAKTEIVKNNIDADDQTDAINTNITHQSDKSNPYDTPPNNAAVPTFHTQGNMGENPYDIPQSTPVSTINREPVNNGYLTPMNNMATISANNNSRPVSNAYLTPTFEEPGSNGGLEETDIHVTMVTENRPFQGHDKEHLIDLDRDATQA